MESCKTELDVKEMRESPTQESLDETSSSSNENSPAKNGVENKLSSAEKEDLDKQSNGKQDVSVSQDTEPSCNSKDTEPSCNNSKDTEPSCNNSKDTEPSCNNSKDTEPSCNNSKDTEPTCNNSKDTEPSCNNSKDTEPTCNNSKDTEPSCNNSKDTEPSCNNSKDTEPSCNNSKDTEPSCNNSKDTEPSCNNSKDTEPSCNNSKDTEPSCNSKNTEPSCNNSKEDQKTVDQNNKISIDKITVGDGSQVLNSSNSNNKVDQKENKSHISTNIDSSSNKHKTIIKLTESDDDVQVLTTKDIAKHTDSAVKINLVNNSIGEIARENQAKRSNELNHTDKFSLLHLQSSNSQSTSLLTLNSNRSNNSQHQRAVSFNTNKKHSLDEQPPVLLSFSLANQQNSYASMAGINLSGVKTSKSFIMNTSLSGIVPYSSSVESNTMNSTVMQSKGGTISSSSHISQNIIMNDIEDSKETQSNSSIEQIEAIKRETLLHSMSTKAQRILKAKAKAELMRKADEKLGPLANFLNNLGLDIVKQSVYQEAIHIQSRKQQAGKLTDVEGSQLDKMRTSCRELAEKLRHLKLSYRKCKLCNFVSESVNVHFWHREHPHINKREDFCCSYCDFFTRNNMAFNFHMEAEHNIKGRSMEKPAFWQCSLCPFEHNSKSKLTQHRWKCEKNFELKTHLSPSPETDINYSLYGVFYLSEKEEALKAIALHKAKQAQLRAQQTQFKIQQQQAAANRANYFNANKISPIQPKPMTQANLNINQRIPVLVHPKIGQPQVPGNQLRNFNARTTTTLQPNRFQQQSQLRPVVGRPTVPAVKQFSPVLLQNNARSSPLVSPNLNKTHQNLNLMRSPLPVKDLINIHQQIKGQNIMTAKSLANQKLIPSNNQPVNDVSEFEICELCGGYVKDREALRIHFFYAHRVEMPALMFEKPCPPLFCDVCEKKFWTSQGLQKHRVSLKHYAKGSLSQVCILCGCLVSHLLNHMTDTHQLNLQDFLNQKRCIVCGKVCQSRSETEIHMAASHGILVKRSNANSMDTKVKPDEKGGSNPVTMMTKVGAATSGSSASQLVKGNYCVFCKVPFASNAELTQHCLLVHKACKKCGMVLPAEGSLGNHRCQISIPTVKACSVCKQEILIQEFIKHVEERHLKKCSIKLKRLNSEEINAGINEKKLHMDLSDGASRSSRSSNIVPRSSSIVVDVAISPLSHKRKREDSDRSMKRSKLLNTSSFDVKSESISISDDDDIEVIDDSKSAETTVSKYKKNGSINDEKNLEISDNASDSDQKKLDDNKELNDSEMEVKSCDLIPSEKESESMTDKNSKEDTTVSSKDNGNQGDIKQDETLATIDSNGDDSAKQQDSSNESDESLSGKDSPVKSGTEGRNMTAKQDSSDESDESLSGKESPVKSSTEERNMTAKQDSSDESDESLSGKESPVKSSTEERNMTAKQDSSDESDESLSGKESPVKSSTEGRNKTAKQDSSDESDESLSGKESPVKSGTEGRNKTAKQDSSDESDESLTGKESPVKSGTEGRNMTAKQQDSSNESDESPTGKESPVKSGTEGRNMTAKQQDSSNESDESFSGKESPVKSGTEERNMTDSSE